MSRILVIGGGAAGLLAAGTAAGRGHEVLLAERNDRPARKVMITGKGRCNLTNDVSDVKEFISNVPVNGRFLYSSVSSFGPPDIMRLMERCGVPLKVERGGRVFPQSDKAVDIVDALVRFDRTAGVRFFKGRAVGFECSDGKITQTVFEDGAKIAADAFILAVGGKSYPLTGSSGDGYPLAASLGHHIIEPRPALVPFVLDGSDFLGMQGLSLKNIAIHIKDTSGKTVYSDFGEMLFTHFGVSGPVILSASVALNDIGKRKYYLAVDLKPALSEEKLDARLVREFDANPAKTLSTVMSALLPRSMIPVVLRRAGVSGTEKCAETSRLLRSSLVRTMKSLDFTVTGTRDFNEAIITSGGVDVRQIDPKTMQSKLCDNLYFAGEIIDVAAYTGGFNLQIAFSTGFAAGNCV
ncbi:MAG: NAD(P)/FAD-dependent oxidoreductase [Clostridia bacterium]|nr:NAD(P)/FAD-dependent oxidoreductase [Clostridia bacterium]